MSDPFGERPTPWWRRTWRSRKGGAPKRYSGPAAAIGPFILWVVPKGPDLAASLILSGAVLLAPPMLVEFWWKQLQRRANERLSIYQT